MLVLISEVWGGFSPEAMRFLGELAQARNDGIDIERASTTWSTSSFTSYHGQLLSLAVQWGVAIEIERAINLTRARELHYRVCAHGALENPSSLYGFKVKSSTGHGAARAAGMAVGGGGVLKPV